MNGLFCGGKHDMTICWEDGLKAKMPQGKMAIADCGYASALPDEAAMLAMPNHLDDKKLKNFKSHARAQHETFNGCIRNFGCLQDTFCHEFNKHKMDFEAVCIIVQDQMDGGAQLFSV